MEWAKRFKLNANIRCGIRSVIAAFVQAPFCKHGEQKKYRSESSLVAGTSIVPFRNRCEILVLGCEKLHFHRTNSLKKDFIKFKISTELQWIFIWDQLHFVLTPFKGGNTIQAWTKAFLVEMETARQSLQRAYWGRFKLFDFHPYESFCADQ